MALHSKIWLCQRMTKKFLISLPEDVFIESRKEGKMTEERFNDLRDVRAERAQNQARLFPYLSK